MTDTFSNVRPIRTCYRCGGPASRVTLARDGNDVGEFNGCGACVQLTALELAKTRPVFNAMLACGVSRELTNSTMTFLLERLYP